MSAGHPGTTGPGHPPLRRNREFVLLWTSAGATMLASRAGGIAYPLLVLWHSGSATQAGLVGFAALLPNLVVQLHAGAMVDRWDRRRLMIACDLGCLLAVGSVATATLLGHVWVAQIMVAAFVQGSLTIFYRLAERAGVRHLVPEQQLPTALSGNEARGQAAGLLGLPTGSVLFTLSRSSPFFFAAAAHLVSLCSLLLIRKAFQEERGNYPKGVNAQVVEGLRWTWRQPFLRTVMALVSGSNLLFQGLSLALMVIVQQSGGSAASLGVITAVSGVGGMLGALSGSWWMRRLSLRGLMIGGMAGWAVLTPLVGLTSSPVLLGLIFALAAHIGSISNVAGGVYQVQITPDALQGRVSAVMGLLGQGANSLGMLAGGAALDAFGATSTVFAIAVAMTLLALFSLLLPPADRTAPLAAADREPAAGEPVPTPPVPAGDAG